MTSKVKERPASLPYRTADYLKTEKDIAHYLEAALEDGDPHLLLLALRNVAEARGMSRVARDAGITRAALYRMLSNNGNPEMKSLNRILSALGFQLSVTRKAA